MTGGKAETTWKGLPLRIWAMAAIFGLLPVVAVFAPGRTDTLVILGGAGLLILDPAACLSVLNRLRPYWPALVLMVWAGVSLLWTSGGAGATARFANLAGTLLLGLLIVAQTGALTGAGREFAGRMAQGAVIALILLHGIEAFTGNWMLNRVLGNGQEGGGSAYPFPDIVVGALLCLLVWPAMALARSRISLWAGAILVAVGYTVIAAGSGGLATLALTGGVIAALAGYAAPRLATAILATLAVVALLIGPVSLGSDSLREALIALTALVGSPGGGAAALWDQAAAAVLAAPLLGAGFGAETAPVLPDTVPASLLNGGLLLWHELGFAGAALAALAAVIAARHCGSADAGDDRVLAASRCGLFATALLLIMGGLGVIDAWWAASILIALCVAGVAGLADVADGERAG